MDAKRLSWCCWRGRQAAELELLALTPGAGMAVSMMLMVTTMVVGMEVMKRMIVARRREGKGTGLLTPLPPSGAQPCRASYQSSDCILRAGIWQ